MKLFQSHTSGLDDARVVVFLHGFMGCAADFAPVAARVEERFRCVRVDLPGHGEAPRAGAELSLPGLAERLVAEVLEGFDRPTLVGYSMGGRLALQVALDSPDALERLVLISTSPGIEGEEARRERRRVDRKRAEKIRDDYEAFLDNWYRLPIFGDLRQAPGYEAMLERRLRNDPEEMARVIVELSPGRQPSNWGRLGQLDDATWVVGGEDPKYAAMGGELNEAGRDVVIVDGAAHALHVEEPGSIARAL